MNGKRARRIRKPARIASSISRGNKMAWKDEARRLEYEKSEKRKQSIIRFRNSEKFKAYQRKWTEEHREQRRASFRKYGASKKGKERDLRFQQSEKFIEYQAAYRLKNKEKRNKMIREWQKKAIENGTTKYIVVRNLRDRLREYMRLKKIPKRLHRNEYGIDFEAIRLKLGARPSDGKQYHLDHIIPCTEWDFSNPEEVRRCFSPENLQWLPAEENLKKAAKCLFYLDID